ncbi:MAG: chitobiase/beta-hexosaminidase C-terminal domain-containing protein [Lachnospiraceae bacterium]|nr:chitobiase/beta-hexosaminidase C-terminal domain-containing protein [Lachnospiraceae bacterium]
MQCPYCGADMLPEQVFCEKCGKERLLVPVYEPEIEDSVAESMQEITNQIDPEPEKIDPMGDTIPTPASLDGSEEKIPQNENEAKEEIVEHKSHPHFFLTAVILMVILVVIFSIVFYTYTETSYDYQYSRALSAYNSHNYTDALNYLNKCLSLDESSVEARMLKIHIFIEQEDMEKVKERCLAVLELDASNQECYNILLKQYLEEEEYGKMAALLNNCPVSSIVDAYAEYAAFAPNFDPEEGSYDETVNLKILIQGSGTVYYTTDGTTPNKYADRYTAPIKLSGGDYDICAVYVNTHGVISEVSRAHYEITVDNQTTPIISPESGDYEKPEFITVTVPDDTYSVYYTTDNSEPTINSSVYSGPIAMPLGYTIYSFLMVDENGKESEIVQTEYECEPDASYSTDQAIELVIQSLMARGEILTPEGLIPGSTDVKEFSCKSAASTDDGVYYLVYEYIKGTDGAKMRSGNVYAINVQTGALYRASVKENGTLVLSDF